MSTLQDRISILGRSLALLGTYALVIGALSVATNISGVADGEIVAICQAVLGVVGVTAGLLVWTLRRAGIDGWQALTAWSVAQLPFIAWSADGNPTTQMLEFLIGFSSSITINGVVTSSEQYGINGIGIILAIWTARSRDRWERKLKPMLDQPVAATTGIA